MAVLQDFIQHRPSWVERFRAEGVDGLRDRSSRLLSLPSQTRPVTCPPAVEALARQRHAGKRTAVEVGISPATASRMRRLGLNRLNFLAARWSSRERNLSPVRPAPGRHETISSG